MKMRALSHVVSSDLLRESFQKRGYKRMEVVVGEDLIEPGLRQELQDKAIEVVEALAERLSNGALRILIPRQSILTKLYLLERPDPIRVIQTSTNLIKSARKAT